MGELRQALRETARQPRCIATVHRRGYRFVAPVTAFEFDETRLELQQAGHVVAVEPRVFQVLRYLLEHHDRVVTKDELLEYCWPDMYAGEAAVSQCLTRLRKMVHRVLHGSGAACSAGQRDPTRHPTISREYSPFLLSLSCRTIFLV
jgi:DNA-binding winged helix-turn-helix (wHTH) protein